MTCAINGERLNVASFGKHLTTTSFSSFFSLVLATGWMESYDHGLSGTSILSFEAHLRSARYD